MEKISVIVPVYNGEKSIARCIDSIMRNWGGNFFDYEVIVVDDGSTDNTPNILRELSSKYSRLKVFGQKNSGPSLARENAISHAECDYLAFCDSDDWVEPDWLMAMYTCLKKHDADFIKCSCFIEYTDNVNANLETRPYEETILNQRESIECFIHHKKLNGILWTNLFKRELFDSLHFNQHLVLFEDAEMVLNLILKSNTIVICNLRKYHYTIHGFSLSNGRITQKKAESTFMFWDGFVKTIAKHYPDMERLALMQRNNVFYNTLFSMYRCSCHDLELENQLRTAIRQNRWGVVQSQKSLLRKLIAFFVCFTPKMASFMLSKL